MPKPKLTLGEWYAVPEIFKAFRGCNGLTSPRMQIVRRMQLIDLRSNGVGVFAYDFTDIAPDHETAMHVMRGARKAVPTKKTALRRIKTQLVISSWEEYEQLRDSDGPKQTVLA